MAGHPVFAAIYDRLFEASEKAGLREWQDRLEKPWGVFTGACHPNRDTGRLLADAFDELDSNPGEFPGGGTALVRPLITGSATR